MMSVQLSSNGVNHGFPPFDKAGQLARPARIAAISSSF
jgi:hypothetical protein